MPAMTGLPVVYPATWFPDLGSIIPGAGSSTREGRGPRFWTAAEKAELWRSVWPYSPCPHHLQPKFCQALVSLMMFPMATLVLSAGWGSATRGHPGGEVRPLPHLPFLLKTHLPGGCPTKRCQGSLVLPVLPAPLLPSCFFFFPLSYPSLPVLSCSCQDVNG